MRNVQRHFVSISNECTTGFGIVMPNAPSPLPLASLWSIATGARYQTQDPADLIAACAAAKTLIGEGGGVTILPGSGIDSIVVTNNPVTALQPFLLVGGSATVQLVARVGSSSSAMAAIIGESFASNMSGGAYTSDLLAQLNGALVLIDPVRNTSIRYPFNVDRVNFLPNGNIILQVPLPAVATPFSALRVTIEWDNSPGSMYDIRPLTAPNGINFFVKYNIDASISVPMGTALSTAPTWRANNLVFMGGLGPDGCWSNANNVAGSLEGHPSSQPGIRAVMLPIRSNASISTSFAHDSYWYAAPIYPDGFLCRNSSFIAMKTSESSQFSTYFPSHNGSVIIQTGLVGPVNMTILPT